MRNKPESPLKLFTALLGKTKGNKWFGTQGGAVRIKLLGCLVKEIMPHKGWKKGMLT